MIGSSSTVDYDYKYNVEIYQTYVPLTVDPGYYFLLMVALFCLVNVMVLPCIVVWGHKYKKYWELEMSHSRETLIERHVYHRIEKIQ